jgi:hypothetical protein
LKPATAHELYVAFGPTTPVAQNDVAPYVREIDEEDPPTDDETYDLAPIFRTGC